MKCPEVIEPDGALPLPRLRLGVSIDRAHVGIGDESRSNRVSAPRATRLTPCRTTRAVKPAAKAAKARQNRIPGPSCSPGMLNVYLPLAPGKCLRPDKPTVGRQYQQKPKPTNFFRTHHGGDIRSRILCFRKGRLNFPRYKPPLGEHQRRSCC